MAKSIRFIHGRRYRFYCNKCGAQRDGVYFREGYDARAKLTCGHERNLGYTLPPEELEREGLMMSADDSPIAKVEREEINTEKEDWERKKITRNRTLY